MDPAATANQISAPRRDFWRDPRPSNQNPNFVRDYFASSRLHFIGSFRARYESMMVTVGKKLGVNPAHLLQASALRGQQSLTRNPAERVIVHIDMDCFFASIAIKKNPSLAGKCIAVAHGGGEISSCSYEARKFGVRAGMFCKDAKKICPELLSVPYDFPMYEEASIEIYALFYDYPGVCVEAVSVDEAYLDITLAVGDSRESSPSDAEALVQGLRSRIVAKTGCTASAGIGPSKLIARLATKAAKPNGQIRIRQEGVFQYLDTLRVKDLPGIGWRTNQRLMHMSVETCPQLRALSLKFLQEEFGERQGQVFFELARALDARPVEPLKPRKSIGAEASWGVRFNENEGEKVQKFLGDIADEVASRVNAAGASGTKVVYKVYKRKPNADMTGYKHLGHGPCTVFTRSTKLHCASPDSLHEALRSTCLRLHGDLGVANDDLRGVGLQMTDLRFADLSFDYTTAPTSGVTRRIDSYFEPKTNPDRSSEAATASKNMSAIGVEDSPETQTQGDFLNAVPTVAVGFRGVDQPDEAGTATTQSAPIANIPESGAPSPKPQRSRPFGAGDVSQQGKEAVHTIQSDLSDGEKDGEVSNLDELEIEEDRVEPGPPQPTLRKNSALRSVSPPSPPASPPSPENRITNLHIPRGWDKQVFLALPTELQKELLAETHASRPEPGNAQGEERRITVEPRRGTGRKRRREQSRYQRVTRASGERGSKRRQTAQVTMTQFADISELKDKGNEMLNAEEFRDRGLRDCVELLEDLRGPRLDVLQREQGQTEGDGHRGGRNGGVSERFGDLVGGSRCGEDGGSGFDIPSPPSLSSDSSESYGVDRIVEQYELRAGDRVYEDEPVSDYANELYEWMRMQEGELRSGHVELVRGRIVEMVRRKRLERVVAEVRVVELFARGMKDWEEAVRGIIEEVQQVCQRMHGFRLVIQAT